MPFPTIEWVGGLPGKARILDQTLLPTEKVFLEIDTVQEMWGAIKRLSVRGAPAIGIAGAMGLLIGVQNFSGTSVSDFLKAVHKERDYLAQSRPTAVNLFWALDRMVRIAEENSKLSVPQLKQRLLDEAKAILEEDKKICRAIGRNGLEIIRDGQGYLTHCNAGGLATADYGTALAVFYAAKEAGRRFRVFADETRPLLQGARLTAFELLESGIDATLICDNMAAVCMREGRIQGVIVGADRIAANGDTANKIGTYGVAVLARHHNIPFYVAAPISTFDPTLPDGSKIPIEERDAAEIRSWFGKQVAPEGVRVYNPAFDVTPHTLIAGIVTEKGLLKNPDTASVKAHLAIP